MSDMTTYDFGPRDCINAHVKLVKMINLWEALQEKISSGLLQDKNFHFTTPQSVFQVKVMLATAAFSGGPVKIGQDLAERIFNLAADLHQIAMMCKVSDADHEEIMRLISDYKPFLSERRYR